MHFNIILPATSISSKDKSEKNINKKPKDFSTCRPWVFLHRGQANELLFKTC